jgi:hypothetical protein
VGQNGHGGGVQVSRDQSRHGHPYFSLKFKINRLGAKQQHKKLGIFAHTKFVPRELELIITSLTELVKLPTMKR